MKIYTQFEEVLYLASRYKNNQTMEKIVFDIRRSLCAKLILVTVAHVLFSSLKVFKFMIENSVSIRVFSRAEQFRMRYTYTGCPEIYPSKRKRNICHFFFN